MFWYFLRSYVALQENLLYIFYLHIYKYIYYIYSIYIYIALPLLVVDHVCRTGSILSTSTIHWDLLQSLLLLLLLQLGLVVVRVV